MVLSVSGLLVETVAASSDHGLDWSTRLSAS